MRNGFRLREMDDILVAQENLIGDAWEAMADPITNRNFDLNLAVLRSDSISNLYSNQTVRHGCDSSFPSLDGSCNHPNNAGRSMDSYRRLLPADFCDGKGAPRCSSSGAPLPSEREISLEMGTRKSSKSLYSN